MILWINGPFGAGKTTLARVLVERIPGAHLFDSEWVGYMLGHVLGGPRPVKNFQEWPAWRSLTVDSIAAVYAELSGTVVVPQSVFVESYWNELRDGIVGRGLDLRAVTLDVSVDELERRIRSDSEETDAAEWRLEHIEPYRAARVWLERETEFVDASVSPELLASAMMARRAT